MRVYTVSKDTKTGLWYAHAKGYSYIPIACSFCEKKSDAMEYAKMYMCLPHKVEQIEQKRHKEFEKWLNTNDGGTTLCLV